MKTFKEYIALLEAKIDDYKGQHTAPNKEYGASLNDITANGMYPKDVYSDKAVHYYGSGDDAEDAAVLRKIHAARNKPDKLISVYRAVPKSAPDIINQGDWITIHRPYAVLHGKSHLNDYKILHEKHPARHIYTNADSLHEFGLDKRD
jgi:hypothetical protein